MTAPAINRIVIVGAGQAAAQAVASLRDEGYAGELTMIGDEAFLPYQRPPLSKAHLQGKTELERLLLRSEDFYRQRACEVLLGTPVAAIERETTTVHLATGRRMQYDRLLLATGSAPRRIRVPGAHLDGIHYLRTLADADALRPALERSRTLAVIGGGYIGLEVAAVAATLGLSVTVFEALERPLARVASPAISHFIAAAHRTAGVSVLLATSLERFEGGDRLSGVRAGGESYPADIALVGIGAVPNCQLAQEAGLATDDGIVVDEFTRTSDPLIFAAGDCTRHPGAHGGPLRLESVQNAVDQARHAALAMLDKPKRYAETPWFWSDQFEIKLQMAGLARADDRAVVRGDPGSGRFSVFHLRGGQISAVEAVNSAPDYMGGRKLIAAGKKIAAERLMDTGVPVKSLL
jgi:3-phenylpropionate/trans-cinnamate dioxygenase ferredoxin reductase component